MFNTKVLKSNLCHYNNAYILVRDDITIAEDNGATIDDDEDLDLVM